MRYKTAFRLALKAVGVMLFFHFLPSLVWAIATSAIVALFAAVGQFSPWLSFQGYDIASMAYQFAGGAVSLAGLYLFFRGEWIVNRAIPGNRRYCPDCGYVLADHARAGRCPECGTPYAMNARELAESLRKQWRWQCERHAADGLENDAREVVQDLLARHAEPHRAYHTAAHVADLLELAQQHRKLLERPELVAWAIWFHDSVYDGTRKDNEQASADLAEAQLSRLRVGSADRFVIRELILDTRHAEPALTHDGRLLQDMDLAILGGDADRYQQYTDAIRREYSFASAEEFAAGRAAFLRSMLARPAIYQSLSMRELFETRARENLQAEMERYGTK